MSNTNTVPSAEAIYDNHVDTYFRSCDNKGFRYHAIKAMHESTRLHLEAMRDEIANSEFVSRSRESIIDAANTYIKNNKL